MGGSTVVCGYCIEEEAQHTTLRQPSAEHEGGAGVGTDVGILLAVNMFFFRWICLLYKLLIGVKGGRKAIFDVLKHKPFKAFLTIAVRAMSLK